MIDLFKILFTAKVAKTPIIIGTQWLQSDN